MKKIVTILGSTGSIGCQAVELIAKHLDECTVNAITANTNIDLLLHQAELLKPKMVVVSDYSFYKQLKSRLNFSSINVAHGEDALIDAASNADFVISSIVGIAGLKTTFAAIKSGALVAIANKESIVCGGNLITAEEMKRIIPIDSEHSAIYRMINKNINKIIITSSGGPFHNNDKEFSLEEALKHPIWNMGKKISIDSATMMNKVLEVIEAHYLFGLEKKNIEILIHPESIIHGMVMNKDGSHKAFMFNPDMRICIAHALSFVFGETVEFSQVLDFTKIAKLTFLEPDYEKFPSLKLINSDQHITINVANELAVSAFLANKISFKDIYSIIAETLEKFHYSCTKSVEEILEVNEKIRCITKKIIHNKVQFFVVS